jgi:hypothetical protein
MKTINQEASEQNHHQLNEFTDEECNNATLSNQHTFPSKISGSGVPLAGGLMRACRSLTNCTSEKQINKSCEDASVIAFKFQISIKQYDCKVP